MCSYRIPPWNVFPSSSFPEIEIRLYAAKIKPKKPKKTAKND
jgi:hypothetical protein